jgi:hypothetical protein
LPRDGSKRKSWEWYPRGKREHHKHAHGYFLVSLVSTTSRT